MSNRVYATMVLALSHLTLLGQGPQAVFEQYLEHISNKSYAEATKLQTEKATARIALSATELEKSKGLGKEAAVHQLMDENAKGYEKVLDVLEMEEEAMIRAKYESGISQAFYLIRKKGKWYVAAPKEVERTGRYYISCMDGEKEVLFAESELRPDQIFRDENLNIAYTLSMKEVDMLKKDPYAYIMMAGKLMTLTIDEVSDKTGRSIEAEKIKGRITRAELIQRSSSSTLYRFDGTFHGERFDNGKFSVSYEVKK
jgi:hypothetical protein